MSKRKYAQISGYTFNSALETIQNRNRHGSKGDRRRNRVVPVLCKKASITWKCEGNELPYTIGTVLLGGMTGMLKKTQTAAGRNWESVPVTVLDNFQLTKTNFKSIKFDVSVSFSGDCVLFIILLHCLIIYMEQVKFIVEGKYCCELFVSCISDLNLNSKDPQINH